MAKRLAEKSLFEQITNKCRHFNGMMNKVCEAGIAYDAVKKSRAEPGAGWDIPCLKDRREASTCDKCEYNTAEDAERRIAAIEESFSRTVLARAAIVEHSQGKHGVSGSLMCPVCKNGNLRYSIAGCNGHIHARCSSADCVSWME